MKRLRYFIHGLVPCYPWEVKLRLVPKYFPHLIENWKKAFEVKL